MADIQVYKRTPERDRILTAVPRRSHVPTGNKVQNVSTRRQAAEEVADDEYKGMFKLVLEAEDEERDDDGNITKEGTYYLSVAWPGHEQDGFVGTVWFTGSHYKYVYWSGQRVNVTSNVNVYLDYYTCEIKIVKDGDTVFSSWELLGSYYQYTHKVEQMVKTTSGLMKNEYSGQFKIEACSAGVFICSGLNYVPLESPEDLTAGIAYVNNNPYTVPVYQGGLPDGESMYYFIRHTFAVTVTSGDEDDSLSDSEKENYRNIINNCNTDIKTLNSEISDIYADIRDTGKERDVYIAQQSKIYSEYSEKKALETSSYNTQKNKIETSIANIQRQIDGLDPDRSDYESKLEQYKNRIDELNEELVSLSNQYKSSIYTIDVECQREINKNEVKINNCNNSIYLNRGKVLEKQQAIATHEKRKNSACISLYGVVPGTSKCEIVALPGTKETAQTDQFVYFYIGQVRVTAEYVSVEQVYNAGSISVYRLGNSCKGLVE